MKDQTKTTNYDYIIIGGGPAGTQLAYFLQKANRNYMVLEAGEASGTFVKNFPRHGQLISINKKYTGSDDPEIKLRMDWNSLLSEDPEQTFTKYSDDYFPKSSQFVEYINDFTKENNLNITYNVRAEKISKDGEFTIAASNDVTYKCKYLIVATGVSIPNRADIPGIDYAEDYTTMSIDPKDFINEKVLIIGKGNSAFETADNLMATTSTIHIAGPSSIKLAWKSHYVGHLRAVNNNFLDTYHLKSQNAIIDAHVKNIEKRDGKLYVTFQFIRADEEMTIAYDRILACTGFKFDVSIFDESARPDMTIRSRFPALTSEWESDKIEDLYFAGVITQSRDFKMSTSAFIHGFRYATRSLFRILEKKNHNVEWENDEIAYEPEDVMNAVIKRVNNTSGLWQQFSFLCDVIVPQPEENTVKHYKEMAIDYVHDSEIGNTSSYYVITLEYGEKQGDKDPFDVTNRRVNQTDAVQELDSEYLHPVVRHYDAGKLVSTHHILENLENEWFHEVHRTPLMEYFAAEFQNEKIPGSLVY